jgi:transcriptional regulator with PAS, ATPase and Fis domain
MRGSLAQTVVAMTNGLERRMNRVVRWPTRNAAEAAQAVAAVTGPLAAVGFAVCQPDSRTAARPALGRHLAIVCRGIRERAACAEWLLELARESPRAHLVIDLTSMRAERRTSGTRHRPADRVSPHALRRRGLRLAREALARGHLQTAEALAVGLSLSQPLVGRHLTPGLRRIVAEVARHRTGRLGQKSSFEERPMLILESVPDVLRVITEAEDDVGALAGVSTWVRTTAGADFVAIVAVADGRALYTDGRRGEMLEEGERLAATRVESTETTMRVDGVSIAAPIRYAGVTIGSLFARGPAEREGTLLHAVEVAAAVVGPSVRARVDRLSMVANPETRVPEIAGGSAAIVAVREAICRAAATPFAVLIEGESGTGKELAARAIHRLSARRERRFTAMNCAALADELADAELFGHTRGAFTGAIGARPGLFEDAHGGSLFLDEVAELSTRAQAKLLRAIQEREVRRIGENATRAVDARLISATNRPLRGLVNQGAFREDLLFRLSVVRLRLPPLRDRPEDIPVLAIRAWQDMRTLGGTKAFLGPDALARLTTYAWPGNVRELQNAMARLSVIAPPRGRVSGRHVDMALADGDKESHQPPQSLDLARQSIERRTVAAALARHGGRRSRAARDLGMTRQGLTKAIRRLHLEDLQPNVDVA